MTADKTTGKTILLVEDSEEDYVVTKRAFTKAGFGLVLERVENVDQALEYLLARAGGREDGTGPEEPSLILLDLNLPGMDGRDFLVQLKRDSRLKQIPVVILTTSNNPRDIMFCYRHGANGYQVKTISFEKFLSSVESMIGYWFETAIIPTAVN